ncbi:hypothetical protein [Fundidesulfovibrio putealis]|uniref:hypothetical protein n=1 Tax=Fundidesulfovibrio putealis TaxID=270496 RepID=UPI0004056AA4|nr:hypothetical protein [Fundidesulfovibrio putealis]
MHVEVFLRDGQGFLRFDRKHTNVHKDEAWGIAAKHGWLIRMQLENGGASVQKLVAY